LSHQNIQKLHIEADAASFPMTERVKENFKEAAAVRISKQGPGETDSAGREAMDKKTLSLMSFRGEFLKPCPGTGEGYICCGYQILNIGTNCPLNCSYCILQAYINQPSLRVFANLPEHLPEIGTRIDKEPERIWRIGTGEFTDSLALDPIAGWHEWLLPFFSSRKNAVLELKSKTDNIRALIESPYRDRIIVSWSLNSPWIASHEEHLAPSLERRIKAASECQKAGFVIGFHFDPLITHTDWRDQYKRTLDLIDRYIAPRRLIWISLGAMRYMPKLKPIIQSRHKDSSVLNGEFVPGLDGKMRYFKPIRIELYGFLREIIKSWHPDPGLYLCMERPEVWLESMGWSPEDSDGLSSFLDDRVRKQFPVIY
jgi:spore photoproduct lyase